MKFIHFNMLELHSEEIISIYGELFKEFKLSNSRISNGYYVLFMIRRLMLAISFNIIKDYPIIQMSIISASCWSIVLYLVIYRPYQDKKTNIIQVSVEICISVVYSVLILLLNQIIDKEAVGWIIFISVNLSYIINLIPILFIAIMKIINRIRAYRDHNNPTKANIKEESSYNMSSNITRPQNDADNYISKVRNIFFSRINK